MTERHKCTTEKEIQRLMLEGMTEQEEEEFIDEANSCAYCKRLLYIALES